MTLVLVHESQHVVRESSEKRHCGQKTADSAQNCGHLSSRQGRVGYQLAQFFSNTFQLFGGDGQKTLPQIDGETKVLQLLNWLQHRLFGIDLHARVVQILKGQAQVPA